ncbi:hypothetical protein [Pseudoalteromonas sp. R3]|uniref:hypothetical protein n=1 Tax=Pseudoalteromonas sp. R3 TaxID=1709477 RepID=UPI000FDEE060|nr:hypothetical protein [Pseudoalteromonas sp. R3]AZZ96608.1 hypothetical protein ELR70_05190 [Pseudoalteromonas sp. R3]
MNKIIGIIGFALGLLASNSAIAGTKLTEREIADRQKYCTNRSYTELLPDDGGVLKVPVQIVDNRGDDPGLGANFFELSLIDVTTGKSTMLLHRSNRAHSHNYTVQLSAAHSYTLNAEYFFWTSNETGDPGTGSGGVGSGGGIRGAIQVH